MLLTGCAHREPAAEPVGSPSAQYLVQVIWPGDGNQPERISFDELPAYFAGDSVADDRYVWYDPFWLTVRGDRVMSIVEQYLP